MKYLVLIGALITSFIMINTEVVAQSNNSSNSGSFVVAGNSIGPETFHYNSLATKVFNWKGLPAENYAAVRATYLEANGSPYLYDRLVDATITLNNDQVIANAKVNYDGYIGNMIGNNEQGEMIIIDARFCKKIVIDDKDAYGVFEKPNPEKSDRFYQVLYDKDGLVFYKDPGVSLRERKVNGILDTPARFKKQYRYYVLNGDNDPVAVNLKKDEVFEHFPEIEMIAINEIIKKKRYKMKKEADYLALFAQL